MLACPQRPRSAEDVVPADAPRACDGSAALRDLRVRLRLLERELGRRAAGLRQHAEGLGRGQVALAVLLCGVGRCGEALVALRGGRVRPRLELPRVCGVRVLAELAVGAGSEDGDVGAGALRQLLVALPCGA